MSGAAQFERVSLRRLKEHEIDIQPDTARIFATERDGCGWGRVGAFVAAGRAAGDAVERATVGAVL